MIDFAVVVPTHHRPELVTQAVDSVLAQTYPAAEIVVVIDGPDEATRAAMSTRPVTVVEQPSAGEAGARNRGIRESRAQWLCFLDDDDLWHPTRLERTAAYLTDHPECQAVTAWFYTFGSGPGAGADLVADDLAQCVALAAEQPKGTDMSYLDITGRSFDLLLERNRGNISTATVRREVLEEAGCFPDGYTCAADWVMTMNVARYTEWHVIHERLSFVRRHPGTNTASNPRNGLVSLQAIRGIWKDTARPVPPHRPLVAYAPDYRWHVQDTMWAALRRRDLRIMREAYRTGRDLLPRRRDRLYALLPPPVTWRVDRVRAGLAG